MQSESRFDNFREFAVWHVRSRAWLANLLLALLPLVAAHGAEPVALLTDMQGGLVRSGVQRLAILSELGLSAPLELAVGARATVVHFAAGRQFDLQGPGVFRITSGGVEAVGGGARLTAHAPLATAYDNVRLRPSKVIQASISMRGTADAKALKLIAPAGTWILETRPDFRWQQLAGVTVYRFQLTDNAGGLLHQADVREERASLPASVELQAGQTYAWQVNASLPDGRQVEGWAEFGVADAGLRNRIVAAQPGEGASFAERVLFALLLEDSGLRDNAQGVWEALLRERPTDPRLQTLGGAR